MTFHVAQSATWRRGVQVSAKKAGTWQHAVGVWQKVNGVWRSPWILCSQVTAGHAAPLWGYNNGSNGSATIYTDRDVSMAGGFSALYYNDSTNRTVFAWGQAGCTQTSFGTTLGIVGSTTINFADAVAFFGGSFPSWEWTGDVLGLVARNGTTFQIEVL